MVCLPRSSFCREHVSCWPPHTESTAASRPHAAPLSDLWSSSHCALAAHCDSRLGPTVLCRPGGAAGLRPRLRGSRGSRVVCRLLRRRHRGRTLAAQRPEPKTTPTPTGGRRQGETEATAFTAPARSGQHAEGDSSSHSQTTRATGAENGAGRRRTRCAQRRTHGGEHSSVSTELAHASPRQEQCSDKSGSC